MPVHFIKAQQNAIGYGVLNKASFIAPDPETLMQAAARARHPFQLYKAILRQTKSLPANQVNDALTETRNLFRKRITETDPVLVLITN